MALTRKQNIEILLEKGLADPAWFELSYDDQRDLVRECKTPTRWINIHSHRVVLAKYDSEARKVSLQSEANPNHKSTKFEHYFAYDYCPAFKVGETPAPMVPMCHFKDAGDKTIREIMSWSIMEWKDPAVTDEIQKLGTRLKLLITKSA
jgi:hypothetical protein